jgi:release factor family 2
VAERVSALAGEVDAQTVIVAGEPHVVGDLRDWLRVGSDTLVVTIAGSRAADRDQSLHKDHVRSALREVAAWQTQRLLELLAEHVDDGLAVRGEAATVRALAAGRVSTLLIVPGACGRRSWFGADPKDIYLGDHEAVRSVRPIRAAPLVHAAVRSALLSGARVRVVPPAGELDGVPMAALCRYGLHQ